VPFNPAEGSGLTIRLQLPNGDIQDIEGRVLGVLPGENPNKAAITLHLHGFTEDIAGTLQALVSSATREPATREVIIKQAKDADTVTRPVGEQAGGTSPSPAASPAASVDVQLPAAEPRDAPIDELVSAPYEPDPDAVSEFEREVFEQLQSELVNLREFAANEVLGVARDAGVEAIRDGYFTRSKHFHPDLFARYRSRAVTHMAQEVFIHINRAYDRMRDTAVADGRAVLAGPALLPHDGWLASLDDIADSDADKPGSSAGLERKSPGKSDDKSTGEVFAAADDFMAAGDYENARALVASVLHNDPRNRKLRALYYFIGGKQAQADDDPVQAASQYQTALSHDRGYQPARDALEQLSGEHGGALPKSLR
jgi:hypothetical protein